MISRIQVFEKIKKTTSIKIIIVIIIDSTTHENAQECSQQADFDIINITIYIIE